MAGILRDQKDECKACPLRSLSLIFCHCERKCETTKYLCIDSGIAVPTYIALTAPTWVWVIDTMYQSMRQPKELPLSRVLRSKKTVKMNNRK